MPGAAIVDDALSAAFASMKLTSVASGAFDAAGEWAIEFPAADGFKLHLVTVGEAWLAIAGARKQLYLAAGDCVLVPGGRSTVLSGSPTPRTVTPLARVKRDAQSGIVRLGRGGACFSLGIHFAFDRQLPAILFARLPPVLQVKGTDELRTHVERFRAEYVQRGVGRAFLLNHLAPIILLEILRGYLADAHVEHPWLGVLTDAKLARVVDAIHAQYREPWTVERLAKIAGMSRSGFALRFKEAVGIAPMDYLANWRIQMACAQLRDGDETIAAIAAAVGYASVSSFSTAFTRALQCRPGAYRRGAQ